MEQISKAPWSKEVIDSLFYYQMDGTFHSYTCPNHGDPTHGPPDLLIPTKAGWICPFCDYTQDWAHKVHTDKSIVQRMSAATAIDIEEYWKNINNTKDNPHAKEEE